MAQSAFVEDRKVFFKFTRTRINMKRPAKKGRNPGPGSFNDPTVNLYESKIIQMDTSIKKKLKMIPILFSETMANALLEIRCKNQNLTLHTMSGEFKLFSYLKRLQVILETVKSLDEIPYSLSLMISLTCQQARAFPLIYERDDESSYFLW
jgi:hypothetical protein